MPSIGLPEWIIIFVIVLIVFGPKQLPRVGSALGKGIREFRDAVRGLTREFDEDDNRSEVADKTVSRQKLPGDQPAPVTETSGTPQA